MEAEKKLSAFDEVECIQYFILLFKKVKGLGHKCHESFLM